MFYHCVNKYRSTNQNDVVRLAGAAKTWDNLKMRHGSEFQQVYIEEYSRNGKDVGGRPVAYLKDVIDSAACFKGDDVVCITNADSCLAVECVEAVMAGLERHSEAVWSSRYDIDKPMRTQLTQQQIKERGEPHRGGDLFAFRWSFWESLRESVPDFLLGYEAWDAILILMLGKERQLESVVYHVLHQTPYWFQKRLTDKGNLYNRALAKKWLVETGRMPEAIKMWPGVRHY